MRRVVFGAVVCALGTAVMSPSLAASSQTALETVAERSGFRVTGRFDEVERLCAEYAKVWPDAVRCSEFGRTPEDRPMLALTVTRTGALTPADARERNVPVMLVQGGIHAGEIDGKDAGFLALREMLQGKLARGALDAFVFVFVPVFNVDGHERFGRWNRPNQNGPEEMGWRVTAQNYNLNRDYAKADAPEMQAMLRLLDAWNPVLYVDLHVTDGAQFEPDVANCLEPIYMGDPGLRDAGRALVSELNQSLAAKGIQALDFYPSFRVPDDPASGFEASVYPARFSTGYWALRNRFSLLVETHSWKDYPRRVRVTHDIIVKLSEMMAKQGRTWQNLAREADARAAALGGQDVVLDYEVGPHTTTIEFRGYAYTREPSAISGALMTRYDTSKPQTWRVPFRDTVVPKLTVRAPRGGYVVPASQAAWLAERLAIHGIRFERLDRGATAAKVEAFRASKVTLTSGTFEGHTLATLEGQWQAEKRDIPAGSLFVPIAQPNARLVMTLLEPQASDSYAAWGFFNGMFEAKEYMEPYVAEQVAQEMLARSPELAREFRERLEDPAFAKDPEARLDFFYRRHPSHDERENLYPILRVASRP
ncbi:MAG: peptidase M14 [Steroidobacteraceae bacterium]|nr:peptidase M14 [Steroidobacteraceae bacterium]